MKKILIRVLILFAVFVLGVAGTALFLSREEHDDRSDMSSASLPEVMVELGGVTANRMCGYTEKMQVDYVRDSVTPISTSREIAVRIDPHEAQVKTLSYEIRTSNGSKVLENQVIRDLQQEDSSLTAVIRLSGDMRMNQEYSLQITLDTDDGDRYYYTRVVQRTQSHVEEYLNFAVSFYEKCMNPGTAEDLGVYLETDADYQSGSYTDVDIHASLDQISWGSLEPEISRKAVPTVKEINENTGSIALEYQISAVNGNGGTEYYEVDEFYRLRYDDGKIRLLDFERSAQQVFDGGQEVMVSDGILVGVADRDIAYKANEEGHVLAFVQQGDLWCYSKEADKLVRIFSFRQQEDGDFRDARDDYGIKIMNVTEEGDVDFVLYGYHNRGIHEGRVGVSVCHYSNDQNVVEEKVFIPSTSSYEFLIRDLEILSYINENNQLFLLLNEALYQVDIAEKTYTVIEEYVPREWSVVSESNARAAWIEGEDPYAAESIKIIDFETLETTTLHAASGQYLRALGFMNEDLVYGITRAENVVEDAEGHKTFAMDTVRIQDFEGNVRKEYSKGGMYITDVTVGQTLMELELSAWEGGRYVVKTTDSIMNNNKTGKDIVTVKRNTTSRQGVGVLLAFTQGVDDTDPLRMYSKVRIPEEVQEITIELSSTETELYYVYGYGSLQGIYVDPVEAIQAADAVSGVVLNRQQQYIWERGNQRTQITLNPQDIPLEYLAANADPEALQEDLGTSGQVLDLTGCTLEQVLYCVSAQRPVIAKTGDSSYALVIGYDEYNTWWYDPATKTAVAHGMQDSTALFENAGNVFITYVETYRE